MRCIITGYALRMGFVIGCLVIRKEKLKCNVHFIYKKKLVMKGIVHSKGFETGIYHQIHHSCNIGKNREHTASPEFAWVDITEVGLSEDVRHTGQQTWITWKDDMLI